MWNNSDNIMIGFRCKNPKKNHKIQNDEYKDLFLYITDVFMYRLYS